MSEPGHSTDKAPDPLQAIRDDLQRREADATNQADRRTRRHQLDDRLADRFRDLISFVGELLAPGQHPRGKTFFADLGCSLLAFNGTLREADRSIPLIAFLSLSQRREPASLPSAPPLPCCCLNLLATSKSCASIWRSRDHARTTYGRCG